MSIVEIKHPIKKGFIAIVFYALISPLNGYAQETTLLNEIKEHSAELWEKSKNVATDIGEQVSDDGSKALEQGKQVGQKLIESGGNVADKVIDNTSQGVAELKEWLNKDQCDENSALCFKDKDEP